VPEVCLLYTFCACFPVCICYLDFRSMEFYIHGSRDSPLKNWAMGCVCHWIKAFSRYCAERTAETKLTDTLTTPFPSPHMVLFVSFSYPLRCNENCHVLRCSWLAPCLTPRRCTFWVAIKRAVNDRLQISQPGFDSLLYNIHSGSGIHPVSNQDYRRLLSRG
jgi:hypothetical protein